ncbi:glycosyltransferase family A protein [Rhodococcus sp. NPDC059234]|uniref:glycosyltransferase family A protein n=1 Tax=Rhodococcus sp. NPDC059234 TaxID=3346781 RepID=UPI00366D9AC7
MSLVEPEPLISFLTTAYRTESYVDEAIESVIAQTRHDWELIVVDNGNSDELAGIVDRYTDDQRITLLRQPNRGYSGGVSAAAGAARGRYFCVLDSDDTVYPDFLERMGSVIEAHADVDAVGCDAELFRDPDDLQGPEGYLDSIGRRHPPDPTRPLSLAELLTEGVPYYSGAIRREVWTALGGYDCELTGVEPDVVLWLRIVDAGRDVRLLPDRLARCRVRTDSSSHDPGNVEDFEQRLQRSFLVVGEESGNRTISAAPDGMLRRLRYAQSLRRARVALLLGDVATARGATRDALRQRRTVRAAVVLTGLRLFPGVLRRVHPTKKRVSAMVNRFRYRLATGLRG